MHVLRHTVEVRQKVVHKGRRAQCLQRIGFHAALTALMARTMRLNVMIQDGEVQVLGGDVTVEVRPLVRQAAK